ncbi:hypothetical protein C8Q80DRAFT_1274893 [Daedaleopsis nitida]|nr:hypothetical protein C8Q80DRAFT_1274893 [Daedaleopsis nitida]
MSILELPPELLEHILVSVAAAGFPHAIAAFAQTNKANRALVYNTTDNHLWREVFLATFDDPRASGGGPGWERCASSKDDHQPWDAFDWGAEYRKRVWAADRFEHRTDPSREPGAEWVTEEEETHRNVRAFDAVLSVISTALPCPFTIELSFLPSTDRPSYTRIPLTPTSNYSTFPPVPQAIGGQADGPGRIFGDSVRARNIAWLEPLLARGLPPKINAIFAGERWDGGLTNQFLERDEFREMHAAGRLMACTGFIPSPPALVPKDIVSAFKDRSITSLSPSASKGDAETTYRSEAKQRSRARRLARMRVYNMRYLTRDRHWGPFLPIAANKNESHRNAVEEDVLLHPILALFSRVTARHQHAGDDSGGDEDEEGDEFDDEITLEDELEHESAIAREDTDDPMEPVFDGNAQAGEVLNNNNDLAGPAEAEADDDDDGTDDTEEGPDPGPAEPGSPATKKPPTSSQLHPDWAYLAAVRVVVEANLRDSFQLADLRGLFSLDGLRSGSAPWDAAAYKPPIEPESSEEPGGSCKGKEKATDDGEIVGWDWAGVTGVWMRCICWMDYRDLILHNLSGEYPESPHLSEAVRVISMNLRIKSYSPSDMPGYTHLPTINIEGETTGASISGQPRRMHGTVSVIADGSVRWTTYSTVEGGVEDEWVTEGVQIGGVASAMGVLGLWTGAQHQRMDPLGPCWAWKVG